ncbi:hybrid sensor histidine kinase/response regulator [Roseovarius sp. C03]|uniref:hybrid sensor histidine kinase/response regulator n=1 Tax=Roseovarius sp. C03 TaxID=3449222 RepID=UPI003EDC2CC6
MKTRMISDTPRPSGKPEFSMRPVIQTIARMIATDRRPSLLASDSGKVLLANPPAQRLGLNQATLREKLDWTTLCTQAHRAGSTAASLSLGTMELEGEVVHISLGARDGYLLRLAENDHEASWLRNRSRSATLLRVAHDLRTPIQSLLATAEKMIETEHATEAERKRDRDQLRHSSEVALDHISNVLGVIRGDQSLAGIRPDETFNITEELRSMLVVIGPIARQRDVELKLRLDPHEDIWVHGPVQFVRALFQNVIDNAAKHGGSEVEIILTCRALPSADGTQDSLRISLVVKDLGGGLPDDQKARLYEALGQTRSLGRATAPRPDRPSAGLNVLAHALRQLGGKLDLEDRHAGDDPAGAVIGTVIEVTIPLLQGKETSPPEATAYHGGAPEGDLSGIGIILVEDSPSSRDWIGQVLRSAGARVWAAGNGAEALSLLDSPDVRDRLNLIITDMTLPYMTGVEFAHRARNAISTPWTGPIIALTAHVGQKIVDACHAGGIEKVIEKPVRPAILREVILNVLDSTRADDAAAAPAAPTPASAPQAPPGPLNSYVVNDLLEQFGKSGAISFMQRALNEASDVLSRLRDDGIGQDTGRMLHAATGACTLTGLATVEKGLRAVELALESQQSIEPGVHQLEAAVQETQHALERLD